MAEKNPFEFKKPDWLRNYETPLHFLKEITGDEEIDPSHVKIASFSDFDPDKTGVSSLILKDNNNYMGELALSRYPDDQIKLEYIKSGKAVIVGAIKNDTQIQEIKNSFIDFKISNDPNKVNVFLGKIFDNVELINSENN